MKVCKLNYDGDGIKPGHLVCFNEKLRGIGCEYCVDRKECMKILSDRSVAEFSFEAGKRKDHDLMRKLAPSINGYYNYFKEEGMQ